MSEDKLGDDGLPCPPSFHCISCLSLHHLNCPWSHLQCPGCSASLSSQILPCCLNLLLFRLLRSPLCCCYLHPGSNRGSASNQCLFTYKVKDIHGLSGAAVPSNLDSPGISETGVPLLCHPLDLLLVKMVLTLHGTSAVATVTQ